MLLQQKKKPRQSRNIAIYHGMRPTCLNVTTAKLLAAIGHATRECSPSQATRPLMTKAQCPCWSAASIASMANKNDRCAGEVFVAARELLEFSHKKIEGYGQGSKKADRNPHRLNAPRGNSLGRPLLYLVWQQQPQQKNQIKQQRKQK